MGEFHKKPNQFVDLLSINVIDLERSLAFYENSIGFRVLSKTDQKAVLTADGNMPLLTIEQPENVTPKEGRTTGLYHFAILLPRRADLGNFIKHLMERNLQFGHADHHVSEAIYIDDPDGNGIEVYRDRPASEWEWTNNEVYMTTEAINGEELLRVSDGNWNGLPSGTIMGHIHLHVKNLEETRHFYEELLGFQVVTNYPGALFMSTGGYHHHFGLNIWNGEGAPAPAESSVGLNWFNIVLPDEDTRKNIVEKLRDNGVSVEKQGDYIVTKDPSENTIHLIVYG